ncbi:MAG TPA: hypothetical protein VFB82_09630, partial [Blastocatellia bacterium]|nr:hypothetical protein [Blastocatellia bacterium]
GISRPRLAEMQRIDWQTLSSFALIRVIRGFNLQRSVTLHLPASESELATDSRPRLAEMQAD